MAEPLPSIDELKRVAVQAGRTAAELRATMRTEIKPDGTAVTNADRAVEQFLRSELERLAPGFAFLGEEYGWHGDDSVPAWVCDPIDGTTNFVHGLPHWGVSIALVRDGTPVLGVLYLPLLNELFWAVQGQGSFRDGNRIFAPDSDGFSAEDTICLSSESVKSLDLSSVTGSLRGLGSIATEMAYTADGRFRAAVGKNPGAVDVAAAACICAEAGCELRWLDGRPVSVGELLTRRKAPSLFVCAPSKTMSLMLSILKQR
ncbi:MAG: inositol monophosphatase family protein [Armatimonadota bacterium]